ncbi:prostaglandin E2 receptor EP4 subtype-like [Hypomesus transpacificus]|uniref:prostaglandin E2 receptor EP4 subtype-like n=1 Tax=Hypomesus transpacificus TaxID=137520 RepID=UPI001F07B001|nr:prostaglandin E2 receptor EP4 subtype-like [Hypomesus transpacificus]
MNDTHGTDDGTVATMAVPVLMFAVGVIGNTIAIVALSRSKQEQKSSAFYSLVCGLAVTDLLGTCLASPITIATYLNAKILEDRHLCEFHAFLLLFFGVLGLSITCAMSAERYLAMCHPYTYQRWGVDRRFARQFMFLIYIANVVFCCFPMMGMANSIPQSSHTWCFIDWRTQQPLPATYSFLYGSVSFLLILITIVLNFTVCGTLIIMRRKTVQRPVTRGSARERWKAISSGAEVQMMIVLMVISVVVLGFSAPLVVRVFVNQITLQDDFQADLTAIRAASVNAILDPWIYILLRRTLFRKIRVLCKRVCHSRQGAVSASPQRSHVYPENVWDTNKYTHVLEAMRISTISPQVPVMVTYATKARPTPTHLP